MVGWGGGWGVFFFFKQKTAYEIGVRLVGSEMCIRDSYNTGTRLGLIHELRLMQCYLMPDETALRELSEGVIEKLKLLTDAEFTELEFPPD